MKVYEFREFGIDNLACVERDAPRPGPGQVLIRVHASSLNYRDLMTVLGTYNPRQKLPLVPLSDGAGEVVEVGEGVQSLAVGDRVAGLFAQAWQAGPFSAAYRRSTLGGPRDGMLAEYVVLDQSGAVPIPDHLSFEEAATLPCAAVTAWSAVMEHGEAQPGRTVVLLGTGGVSIFALQFAALAGARVIVTSSSDEKLARARELGAWETINYRQTPEWQERVKELTDGQGADHVVEVGGAGTLQRSLTAVGIGGRVSMIGVVAGAETTLDVRMILMRCVDLQGIVVGSRRSFEAMNRAIAYHGLRPVVDTRFGFDRAADAFRHMEAGKHFGKIVLAHAA